MTSLSSRTGIGDTARVAILAALHLADELEAAREESSALRAQLTERSRRIAALLDHLQVAIDAPPQPETNQTN